MRRPFVKFPVGDLSTTTGDHIAAKIDMIHLTLFDFKDFRHLEINHWFFVFSVKSKFVIFKNSKIPLDDVSAKIVKNRQIWNKTSEIWIIQKIYI